MREFVLKWFVMAAAAVPTTSIHGPWEEEEEGKREGGRKKEGRRKSKKRRIGGLNGPMCFCTVDRYDEQYADRTTSLGSFRLQRFLLAG